MKLRIFFNDKTKKKNIIFSLPKSNHYQKIKNKNLIINHNFWKIIKEKKWGNEIIVFRLNDVSKKPKIIIDFIPQSYKKTISNYFSLNDYQYKKHKVINNQFINGNHPVIKKISKKIIGKEKNLKKIFQKLYSYVLKYLAYGKPTENLYSYQQALKDKITDCGGFSTFLGSLLQSQNIPTRLVVGFIIKKDIFSKILTFNFSFLSLNFLLIHAWLEAQLPDKTWLPMDPSIEWLRNKKLSQRQGGFGFIPDDRLVVSFGCDFRFKINQKWYKIDLLQKPIYF